MQLVVPFGSKDGRETHNQKPDYVQSHARVSSCLGRFWMTYLTRQEKEGRAFLNSFFLLIGERLEDGHLTGGGRMRPKKIGGKQKKPDRKVPYIVIPKHLSGGDTISDEYPVGGRLKFFYHQWENITSNQWILQLIKSGLRLDFFKLPQDNFVVTSLKAPEQQEALQLEILSLLAKNVLIEVPINQEGRGFYSSLFLVPKPDGTFRTIINLKRLNAFLVEHTFKMESIRSTIKLLFPRCFMAGLDLKDAYYHLPIHIEHQQYLRVAVVLQGRIRHFQFTAMPFGLSMAPRIFTKLMLEVMAHLRHQDTLIVPYLDDFLIIGNSASQCEKRLSNTVSSLQALGWIINFKKSRLLPETRQSFLGLVLDSLRGSHVKIRSDNTTVVAYLNRQGGTRSESLMCSAADIFDLAEPNFLSLTAVHIRGIENSRADFLSRHTLRQGEWTLNPRIFKNIVDIWGLPQIDLFATRSNRQVPMFASLNVADRPDLVDSLQYPWNYDLAYAFPPMMLIPLVIKKIREERSKVILIAPFWPKRPWFSCLRAMSVCDPWILPVTTDLLFQGPFYHPQVKGLHLTAWNLRGRY
ncbi:uncharacterized protein LOC143782553 [Ranitomeya variabilis]|uniref:uncharacterized protein LOC143776392 n=2 Tax=Ranitomeya variabilis TaxID=490064 RepID=UPI004055E8DD